jgi:membrane protein
MKKKHKTQVRNLPLLIVVETYKNWRQDRTLRLGAGLAYYGVFAIVPILTLMIGVAAYFFSAQDVSLFTKEAFDRIFSTELSISINQLVDRIAAESTQNTITMSTIISLSVLVVTASFIFVAFQDALDTIWHNPIRLGWKKWVKKYLWAYLVVMIVSLVLFSVLLINSIGNFAVSVLPGRFEALEYLTNVAVRIGMWVLGILVLVLIYRVLIYQKINWSILIISSAVTAFLIFVGTWLLGLYITNYARGSISGAVGAVLLLLVWVYYEAQIILIGAQIIKTLDKYKEKLPSIFAR